MPDRYYITAYILRDNWIVNENDIDTIEHAGTLDIEVSNYYKSDRGIDKWWGIVFLPCVWDIKGLNERGESVKAK